MRFYRWLLSLFRKDDKKLKMRIGKWPAYMALTTPEDRKKWREKK